MGMNTRPAPANEAEARRDSARLDWIEEARDVRAKEWYRPGAKGPECFWQLTDDNDDEIGKGPTLRAAIDDAISRREHPTAATISL